jgi:tetratricopeptide (TPR) repeat protein
LDPHYALAMASRSIALSYGAAEAATRALAREGFDKAQADARQAVALAPGNAQVLRISGLFAAYMRHIDSGLAAARRAVVLDPLARDSHSLLGRALYAARRYEEAVVAFFETESIIWRCHGISVRRVLRAARR